MQWQSNKENEEVNKRANALKKYFQLDDGELLLPTPDQYYDEFTINTGGDDHFIEVVTMKQALITMIDFYGVQSCFEDEQIDLESIGFYFRLGDSPYYYRRL